MYSMKKFGYLVIITVLFLSCVARREPLVPVLLDYELYYPDEAREQGLEGKVTVRVFIDRDGKTSKVSIHTTSGSALLDSAALRTAKTFTFSPGMRDVEAVQTWALVPIEFKLKIVHPEFWVTEVTILQHMINSQYNKEWISSLYDLYKQMIYLPQKVDNVEGNNYILQAVHKNTARLWEGFWDSYPANILLFIDIIERYPESFTSLQAEADFNNFLKKETPRMKLILSLPQADTLINRLLKAVE